MTDQVELRFVSRRYARTSHPTFVVRHDDWSPSVSNWIWPAMVRYAKGLALSPRNVTEWDSLKFGLPGLSMVFSWEGFCSLPIGDLEPEDLRDLFQDIDDTFHVLWGGNRGGLRSSRVRAFLLNYLLSQRSDGTLIRARMMFSPKGRAYSQPRSLFSDQVDVNSKGERQPPVGAMRYRNTKDLKAIQLARLEQDLERISHACVEELNSYANACSVVERIRSKSFLRSAIAESLEILRAGRIKSIVLTEAEMAPLLAEYAALDAMPKAAFESPDYLGTDILGPYLADLMGVDQPRLLRALRYAYYPNQEVLVAAILAIQIQTGWNISSVMELSARNISALPHGGGYLIQSVKTRTGDDTPQNLVEGAENPAVVAIQFALNRLSLLKERGWAASAESSLWLSPRSNYAKSKGLQISNLAKGLVKLREKYRLPKFTFEQIRVQKLTTVHLRRGPIAAAEMAGHSSYTVIGGYIDHLATRTLNSAVNLEFQKRWEEEVFAPLEVKGRTTGRLIPIGDGTSCKDAAEPPSPSWLKAGMCEGVSCHVGGGCANRVVQITPERINEVILTRKYYLANWKRLRASNPDQFATLHMPNMEFNFYLYEHLRQGPYRSLLNDAA